MKGKKKFLCLVHAGAGPFYIFRHDFSYEVYFKTGERMSELSATTICETSSKKTIKTAVFTNKSAC